MGQIEDISQAMFQKWILVRDGKIVELGPMNCRLCHLYLNFSKRTCSVFCPIRYETQKDGCCGTPYKEWVVHRAKVHQSVASGYVICPVCREIAQKEVWFLYNLMFKYQKGGSQSNGQHSSR